MKGLNPNFEKYCKGFDKGYGKIPIVIGDYLRGGWIKHMNCKDPELQGFYDGKLYRIEQERKKNKRRY